MRRREFIAALGGATAAWPLAARAQPAKVYTIGVLALASPDPAPLVAALREGLQDAGYVEGRNLRLEIRSAAAAPDLQLQNAIELVRLKVDLIVTFFTPTTLAAKRATREIPIVMAGAGDPVATGIVDSLARPGGNVTGLSGAGADVAGKSVEILRELRPGARRIGVVFNTADPFGSSYAAQIGAAAGSVGMEIENIATKTGEPLDAAFRALTEKGVAALMIQASESHKETLDLAIKHRLPAFTSNRLGPTRGALMSYGSDYFALVRQSAVYIDKILNGAAPANLPVAFPTKFELIVNLKTAKAIGLDIPPTLLARADEVIE